VGTGNIGCTHVMALPALLMLAGCAAFTTATAPPPPAPVAVVPANAIVKACTESGADAKGTKVREAVCLDELGKRASRKGDVLSLKLENGTTKTFRSNPGACKREGRSEKCVEYNLVGFYPTYATGAYLVAVQWFESVEYTLVSAATGETNTIEGVPRLAPDHSTFFVKGCDNRTGCRISIKPMASSAPPVWVRTGEDPDADDWNFMRWIDNDRIALRIASKNSRCPQADCEAILKRTGDSWAVENLPPKG
jgi:hypothetical protein